MAQLSTWKNLGEKIVALCNSSEQLFYVDMIFFTIVMTLKIHTGFSHVYNVK